MRVRVGAARHPAEAGQNREERNEAINHSRLPTVAADALIFPLE
jgi:hypothetical protein